MSPKFIPCPSCARHVRQGDRACPFCGAEDPCANAPPTRTVASQLSRSALLTLSAMGAMGTAVAATDCSSSSPIVPYGVPPFPGDATLAEDSAVAADGGPSAPEDAAREGAVLAPLEGGSVQPVYGAPVPPVGTTQK